MTAATHHHVIPGGRSNRSLTDGSWRMHAVCDIAIHGDTFFDTTSASVTVARYLAAKAVCRTCPVVKTCLAYTVENTGRWKEFGVWGGLTPAERQDTDVVARVLAAGAEAIPDLYFQWCALCGTEKVYATNGRVQGVGWYCQKAPCRRRAAKGAPKPRVAA